MHEEAAGVSQLRGCRKYSARLSVWRMVDCTDVVIASPASVAHGVWHMWQMPRAQHVGHAC